MSSKITVLVLAVMLSLQMLTTSASQLTAKEIQNGNELTKNSTKTTPCVCMSRWNCNGRPINSE